MRRSITTVAAALTLAAAGTGFAPVQQSDRETLVRAASCSKTYTRAMFHLGARSAFRGDRPVPAAKRARLAKFVRCQRGGERSRRIVRRHLARYKRHHRRRVANRRAMLALTPYDCGSIGRFSIPCYIVRCESGGRWDAVGSPTPHGRAVGPYQFLGWPVPWPVRTAAHRLAHHRMARTLAADGLAQHWSQCM